MRKRVLVWFCLPFFLCVASVSLMSQETTGSLTGKVTDDTGVALPGVSVVLNSPALVTKNLTTVTNDSGWYIFRGLPPGVYSAKASIQGFETLEKTGVIVEQSKGYRVDFSLKIGAIAESTTVTASAPLIDTTRAGSTQTLETVLLTNLPATTQGRRQYSEIIRVLPGVTDDSREGQGGSPMIYGNRKFDVGYRVEGVQTNDLSYGWFAGFVPMDALEEIQVKGSAISADNGWNQGGVVTMRFKSGGNEFHGSVSDYFSNNNLWGNTALKSTNNQATFTLGGPILKDKIWFFLAYEWTNGITDIFGRTDGIRYINHNPQLVAKATARLNSKNRLSANLYSSRTSRFNSLSSGPDYSVDSIGNSGYWTDSIGFDLASTLSNSLFLETHFDFRKFQCYATYKGDNTFIRTSSDIFTTLPNGYRVQGQPNGDHDWYNQYDADMKLSTFLEGAGAHNAMFGWDMFRWNAKLQIDTRPEYIIYDDPEIPGGVGVLSTQLIPNINPYKNKMASYALYANDDWIISDRLTANLGLRFGVDDFYRTNYHLEPRLGINLDPFGDARSRLKVSFSRFYGAIYVRNISVNQQSSTQSQLFVFDPDSPTYTGGLLSTDIEAASAAFNNPDLKTPYTDEFAATIEREITKDILASVSYIRRWQKDQFVFVDANVDPQTGEYLGDTSLPELANLGIGNYNGLEIVLKKRFSHRYQWQVSYNWSKSNNTVDNAYLYYLPFPTNQIVSRYGTSDDSIPHFFRGVFSVLLPLDIQLSGYFSYRTGRPYSRYNTAYNYDLTPFESEFIGERNEYRLPAFTDLSVHVEKVFNVKKVQLGLIAEIMNVFDSKSVTRVYTSGARFGLTRNTRLGRAFQLAARLRF